jgi:hypothetical protein
MGKFLELMRVGKFKDRHGKEYDITQGVIDKIAAGFTPSKPPALTVGHPDAAKPPLFGVVDALKVAGDKLLFRPAKFAAEFAALVSKGMFPGVSAGLTADLSRLDHVALLSAQKPAIDGLEPVAEFSALPAGETVSIDVTEFAAPGLAEFSAAEAPGWWVASRLQEAAGLFRGLKNYLIEAAGSEKAETLIPEWAISRLQDEPPEPETAGEDAGFSSAPDSSEGSLSEAGTTRRKIPGGDALDTVDYEARYNELLPQFENAVKTVAAINETNKRLAAENMGLAKKAEALEKSNRLAEFEAWVEGRIAEGRVLPDEKTAIVERMESLCRLSGAEFSKEVGGDTTPLNCYRAELMNRPRRKLTEPIAPPQFASAAGGSDNASFKKMVHNYEDEMKAKGTPVNYFDAVDHVRRLTAG